MKLRTYVHDESMQVIHYQQGGRTVWSSATKAKKEKEDLCSLSPQLYLFGGNVPLIEEEMWINTWL